MGQRVDLVFRTVGERTSALALRLAVQHLQPQSVHVLENRTPFWQTVKDMLAIAYEGDYVVFMDADCLILQDLRPFLETNAEAHVDACLLDRFRGRVTAGLHVTRSDVVRAMRDVEPDPHDPGYYLKPESWTRWRALVRMGEWEGLRRVRALHDFEQDYAHLFVKYVVRDLRSRKAHLRASFDRTMSRWDSVDPDFRAARSGVEYSRRRWHPRAPRGEELSRVLPTLPEIAREQLLGSSLRPKPALTRSRVEALARSPDLLARFDERPRRVFGLTLSPCLGRSASRALAGLGLNVAQNGGPQLGARETSLSRRLLATLAEFDGVVGVGFARFYAELDAAFPDARFVLLVHEREAWLREVEAAGAEPGAHSRALARALGSPSIDAPPSRSWLLWNAGAYHREVEKHFEARPGKLIRIDAPADAGWEAIEGRLARAVAEDACENGTGSRRLAVG